MATQNPREIALRVLEERQQSGIYVETLLDRVLTGPHALSGLDRALCQELVYGTVRWQATLDWLISRKTENRQQEARVQILLRLGLYQLFWLTRIPDHAAVFETVALARTHGLSRKAGFINAVLRSYVREATATRRELERLKKEQPALGSSHPEWLVRRWMGRWAEDETRKLLEWNNTPPPVFARVNSLKTDAGRLIERWRDEGVGYDFFTRDWIPENLVFRLKEHPPLAQLGSFRDGWFYLQDPSTLLAAEFINPKPGEAILDLCAAPGGKLTYIAQRVANEARLVGRDISSERVKLLEENCRRLGVRAELGTTMATDRGVGSQYDRILLDVPCSNTGVIRRRVDLRWRLSEEQITALAAAQRSLLNEAAAALKPAGVLVYSTCSLETEENQQTVLKFLKEHPEFTQERERELLPFRDGVDGAFVALLRRR